MKPLAIFIELRGAFVIAGWHVRWTNASGEPHEFLEILMHRPPEGYRLGFIESDGVTVGEFAKEPKDHAEAFAWVEENHRENQARGHLSHRVVCVRIDSADANEVRKKLATLTSAMHGAIGVPKKGA